MGMRWVLVAVMAFGCGETALSKVDGGGSGGQTSTSTDDAGIGAAGTNPASGGGGGQAPDVDASMGTGTGANPGCAAGDEGCACYGNNTCNAGLTCASKLCVDLETRDAGGGVGGASGAPDSGNNGGAGGAQGGAGGVRGDGGAGGAHQCFPDQTICNADPGGCCLGLRCVSATGAPNAVCTPVCSYDNECASGCCAPLENGTAKVCAPEQYCSGSCIPVASSCTSAASACCAGTQCVYDDETTSTATCASTCRSDSECISGCCAPLADGSGSVCSNPSYCVGSCLPAGTRPCGIDAPCCPGSYCTADATNQICLPLCSTHADCVSGCCAVPNGNGVHVCTDPAYCN
jgi:hypothetical protein